MTSPPADPEPPRVEGVLRQLPNALTVLRIVLALGVFASLSVYRFPDVHAWALPTALVLFVAAAVTDALDGFLARRWRVISPFGRIFDPFADKFLVLGSFICLAGPAFNMVWEREDGSEIFLQITRIEPWMVIALLSRELLVTTIRGYCESRGIDFSATLSGKLKMIAQSISVPGILLATMWAASGGVLGDDGMPAKEIRIAEIVNASLAWITVLITLYSAVPYTLRGFRGLRAFAERKESTPAE